MSGIPSSPVAASDGERDYAVLSARLWRRTWWIHLMAAVVLGGGVAFTLWGHSWPFALGLAVVVGGGYVVGRLYRWRTRIPHGGTSTAGSWTILVPFALLMLLAMGFGFAWRGNIMIATIVGLVCGAAIFAAGVLSERRQLRADLEAEAESEAQVATS